MMKDFGIFSDRIYRIFLSCFVLLSCLNPAGGFNPDASGTRSVDLESKPEPSRRRDVQRVPIDFGPAITEGALRCELKKNMIVVTPLPNLNSFTVTLRVDKLTSIKGMQVKSITAINTDGTKIRSVKFDTKANLANFQTRKSEFAYQVLLNRL